MPNFTQRSTILLSSVALKPLEGWEPVGVLLEEARLTLHNEGGMTQEAYERLCDWAGIWQGLDSRLHALYAVDDKSHGCLYAGLAAIMYGNQPPSGATYAYLRERWTEQNGYPPSIELAPRKIK